MQLKSSNEEIWKKSWQWIERKEKGNFIIVSDYKKI